jgi:GNAT superfamily N-acetyltransferase
VKVYLVGDSISIQYGPYLQTYLAGTMEYARKEGDEEALLNLDQPQGANGGDSGMVRSFLAAKAASGGIDADLLLVNCGLHDIKTDPDTGEKQVPIDAYTENLRAIVAISAAMKPRLIWIRTTPCDEAVHNQAGMTFHRFSADCDAYNRVADQVMAGHNVPVIDLYAFTLNLGADLYCDHVHFRDPVREKQAAFLTGWLMAFTKHGNAQPGTAREVVADGNSGGRRSSAAVHYRRVVPSDMPVLARLRGEGEAGGASEERMGRYLAGEHHPQQALLSRVMYVAAEAGAPIGYVAGHLTRRFGCDGELQWIYVVPEHRGTRVAAELLCLLATWFVEQGARRVCVDVGDERARHFYKRHGAVDLNKHWLVWNDVSAVIGDTASQGSDAGR